MEYPEHKFDGKVEILERRHVYADSIVCIGKEENNIDMQEPEGDRVGSYLNIEKINEWVLCLTLDDVWEMGIEHRSTLKQLKDRVREGGF
ncbi:MULTISPECIES: hypothetical protein [Methanococcoides]|uniref:Uncharacterized protein n=1 Tax=Methanococcoides seepicolus TaxID=2828780 RepID=A0A9E4ZC90_9EURY|nr:MULTISPECIES: hypothetical protein [Methanococcoides]MCM1985537.1 hypothetical protein [Methanococcoides seepicolus]